MKKQLAASSVEELRLNPDDKWALYGCLHTEGPMFKGTLGGITTTTTTPAFLLLFHENKVKLSTANAFKEMQHLERETHARRRRGRASERGPFDIQLRRPQKYIRI